VLVVVDGTVDGVGMVWAAVVKTVEVVLVLVVATVVEVEVPQEQMARARRARATHPAARCAHAE